ncbi:hypothetical protein DFQ27_003015 [Actinomortierella ambigua]|uniref:Phospholipid/glycerol acyltransferase domain-containing protein n=1 Tax=Actinomortierella ambigua TaxID=1343610 RepID=A0A9P6UBN7_9FUNG|nr:hypothetical protein DFQ27_003015 [Actinomortierella ambigua]
MPRRKIPGLYSFIKLLCRTLFHIFFRNHNAFHIDGIPTDEPLLVISNHGNYLLDGLALLATFPGQISFLMAQPNFKTAIGGIARKIGAIPVMRPQDAERFEGTSLVTIGDDGLTLTGQDVGREVQAGDTVYVECGSFQYSTKDDRVTQCFGIVQTIVNDDEVTIKAPGLKWVPVTLTSEQDIAYIKSRKIVRYGSLKIRVERGNTFSGIYNALEMQRRQQDMVTQQQREQEQRRLQQQQQQQQDQSQQSSFVERVASSTTGTINKFMQRLTRKPSSSSVRLEDGRRVYDIEASGNGGDSSRPSTEVVTETSPLLMRSVSSSSRVIQPYSSAGQSSSGALPQSSHTANTRGHPPALPTRESSFIVNPRASFSTTHTVGHLDGDDHGTELEHGHSHQGGHGEVVEDHPQDRVGVLPDQSDLPSLPGPRFPARPCSYQYSHPIDHSVIYESVWKNFDNDRTVAIFPEGVSSDDYHLLDFKYGCTIMVLGYLSQHPSRTLRIIPCGLNFFNRHRFRSRFYADYGAPLTVPQRLVDKYREGGEGKKQACTELLQMIHQSVYDLTLNAADYDELRLYKATRRLYSTGTKLTVPQKLELTRRFAKGFQSLTDSVSVGSLKRDIKAFDRHLTNHHVLDWQLTATPSLWASLLLILPGLLLLPLLFLLSLPGTLLFGPVGLLATWAAKMKGAQAMLAFQTYLPVSRWPGRDVIATWKIIVALALTPICFVVYSIGVTVVVAKSSYWLSGFGGLHDPAYWTTPKLVLVWCLSCFVFFPAVAFSTVWIWEWQIDLKRRIQIWWWRISGRRADMKRWRQELVGRVRQDLVGRMGGHDAFDVTKHR